MENDILDDFSNEGKLPYFEIVQWWEKRRLFYSGILMIPIIGLMFFYWEGTLSFGIYFAIFGTMGHLFVANCF